jgi:hypothetical protein
LERTIRLLHPYLQELTSIAEIEFRRQQLLSIIY